MDKHRVFWVLFGFTLLIIIGMQVSGAPLVTEAAPGGIITFELVGSLEGSQEIIQSWQGQPMVWAGVNMGLDFLFLVFYSMSIALGCILIADRFNHLNIIKKIGIGAAIAIFIAAGLDVLENIALIKLLTGSTNAMLPQIARWCAIPKFTLVLLSMLYVLSGTIGVLYKKIIP